MTSKSISQFIVDEEIIGFFDKPLSLKSGRQSHFYVNWRRATNDAYLLDQLSDYIVAFVRSQGLSFQTLYGVPEGASKTSIITAFKLAKLADNFGPRSHTISMGRAKQKLHGEPADRYFIGQPTGVTYVLEDTVTTGLSLFHCLDQLLEAGVNVGGVICLTDRCELRADGLQVAEYLKQRYGPQLAYHPLSRAPDLLRLALAQKNPPASLVRALESELGLSEGELSHGLS